MASASVTAGRSRGKARRSGRGRVLAEALDQVERFPALVSARDRTLELLDRRASTSELAEAVESDVGVAIATFRAASLLPRPRLVSSASDVVEALEPAQLAAAIRATPVYAPFEESSTAGVDPERFRLHSLTVQRVADSVAAATGSPDRDPIALAALLHDVGRLVMARLHAGYAERFDRRLGAPEERLTAERRELGIDHALVGGVVSRRWKLSGSVAGAIERHHSSTGGGAATIVRVADMIAAHLDGYPVNPEALMSAAASCGLESQGLGDLLYTLPRGAKRPRRVSGPCPLSARELEVLRGLSEGKVYKQIAVDLTLSASTVRSHLHNVYGKLGALDRAQAVLIATERGWL
jgi:putative nucleotidyltransferase with HDIG domain